jgi:[acyl-carrier-protein] S-malonyltransferase
MHEAGQKHPGTLAAIIGLEAGRVEELCREASSDGVVVLANLNCPGQLVVSGEKKAIETLGRLATEAGATKVMPLAVSAAFHSPLMNEAAEKLARRLDQVKFSDASIPVYCNVTGDPVQSGEEIRKLMKIQITSRVQWEKGIRRMMADGIDTFVEIGPGKALSGMIKRIDRKAGMFNFYNMSCADKLAQMESEAALTRA